MNLVEYKSLDGIGLSEALDQGRVSARRLMELAIEAAAAANASYNCITYTRYDAALAEVSAATTDNGPERSGFSAIPFLLKDSGLPCTELPSSVGSRLFDGTTFDFDATLTSRFRQAGLVPFGRTAVPEMCMAPTTEARRNGGATVNPYDITRSCGGSSGGAAVAVACGVVPVAHASDGAGSIRIPGSCCGIFGLKPSRGRMPTGPLPSSDWGGLATTGVLTRTVRDTARVLDLVANAIPGAPHAIAPGSCFEQNLQRPFETPLRVGVWTDPWGLDVDPVCLQAVSRTAAICESLGHDVAHVDPPAFDYEDFLDAIVTMMAANITASVQRKFAGNPRPPADGELEPAILDGYFKGESLGAADYIRSINKLGSASYMMARMFGDFDVILTPTLTTLPAKLGTISTDVADFARFRHDVGRMTPFLAVINASGQPAVTVPMWRENNLPVGVQIIGRYGCEDTLLRVAARLEQTDDWKQAQTGRFDDSGSGCG